MQSAMIFQQAKQTDLVRLLANLGFKPEQIRQPDYWYRSPLRQEHTASFKVNRSRNIWYDHGEGIGGNIIDFAMRFFRCDATAAAQKILELETAGTLSFHPQEQSSPQAGEKKDSGRGKILITGTQPLQNNMLLTYLEKRKIPLHIAASFCEEVDFSLYGKQYKAIGFPNRSGGFELRSSSFKGSSSPKDISFIDNGKPDVFVFEGFFDFLSYATLQQRVSACPGNFLILNSLSFFQKSRSLMEQHNRVLLFSRQRPIA